ncbi:MAG TPA: pyridoxamine 5'-phosphate oxidase [Gemmatimonadaceae bacterium]|nr:pyridoxamine 5'-phosphate oxidase [Gemmatimonadaceae bacterium]
MLDPITRFQDLLVAAERIDRAYLAEPTAFCLATVGAGGSPSARMLLLKGVDQHGFVFYTNLESRKGRELNAAPMAAMCFHWQPLESQVRVEGRVTPVSDDEADAYFASRPRASQLGAWASDQSRPMAQPGDLEERLAEYEARFAGAAVPRPRFWSGYRLVPERIEFWRNRPGRLHDRELYERAADGWKVTRLYP